MTERVRARRLRLQETCLLWGKEWLERLLWLLLLLSLQTERVRSTHRHRSVLWHEEARGLRLQLWLPECLCAEHGTSHHLLLLERVLHGLIVEIGCCWAAVTLAKLKYTSRRLNSPVCLWVEHRLLLRLDSAEEVDQGLLPRSFRPRIRLFRRTSLCRFW